MISLKMPPEEGNETALGMSEPKYGYGTRLCLEEEQVKALGAEKLAVGTRVKITAYAVVTSTRIDIDEPDEGAPNMEVQLTDMELVAASSVNASAMYPSSNG